MFFMVMILTICTLFGRYILKRRMRRIFISLAMEEFDAHKLTSSKEVVGFSDRYHNGHYKSLIYQYLEYMQLGSAFRSI